MTMRTPGIIVIVAVVAACSIVLGVAPAFGSLSGFRPTHEARPVPLPEARRATQQLAKDADTFDDYTYRIACVEHRRSTSCVLDLRGGQPMWWRVSMYMRPDGDVVASARIELQ